MEGKVLWATVCLNGGIYTVHYAKQGSSESIHSEGYEKSMIENLPKGTPIFRFDKSDYKKVIKFACSDNTFCREYRSKGMFDHPDDVLSLTEYVRNAMENYNIVVEYA